MPSINYLNQPPHPFWDFVANIEDHPFFSAYANPRQNTDQPQAEQGAQQQSQGTEKAAEPTSKHATVEDAAADEPPRYRSIGENDHRSKEKDSDAPKDTPPDPEKQMPFRGRCGPRGEGPRHHRGGPCGAGFGGRGGRGGFGHRGRGGPHGHPWWAGPAGHHPHGPPHHHHGGPPRGGNNPFGLPDFIQNLGSQLGLDLSDLPNNKAASETDFEPRADVFDTKTAYIVHASLPGAHKSDVGVEWDAENSTLRITGVVHRPGADEELLKALAVDGRKREVGVFEKAIHLGTRRSPANIVVEDISAKMQEGILIVNVPKAEWNKTEIRIGSQSPDKAEKEREVSMESETVRGDERENLMDVEPNEKGDAPASHEAEKKEHEHEHEHEHESGHTSEEEGEYVRIDVD